MTTQFTSRRKIAVSVAAFTTLMLTLTSPVTVQAVPTPTSGPTTSSTTVTDTVPGVRFTEVFAGHGFSLALDSDGIAYAWGYNAYGQLGNGTTVDSGIPQPVHAPPGVTFTDIGAGFYFAFATGSDGNLYMWGQNDSGQLGDGTQTNRLVPTQVLAPAGVTFSDVSGGVRHTLALGSDGNAYGWGGQGFAELGPAGSAVLQPVVLEPPAGVTISDLEAGGWRTFAIGSDGNIYGMGYNTVGDIDPGGPSPVPDFVKIDGPAGVTFSDIRTSIEDQHVTGSDGNIYGWGNNQSGDVGDGSNTQRTTPVLVSVPSGVTFAEASGGLGRAALGSDGGLYTWGANSMGQLGDGTTTNRFTPTLTPTPSGVQYVILADSVSTHKLAIDSDGQLWAWGANFTGQQGDGTLIDRPDQHPITSDITVTGVAFGGIAGTNFSATGASYQVDAPAGGCGPVDVVVEYTQFGASHTYTTTNGFTYGTPVDITAQPASGTVTLGSSFTATVGATGDAAPTVQWQQADVGGVWSDIAGQTSNTLNVTPTQDTSYRAVVTNCFGSVTSDTIQATVAAEQPAASLVQSIVTDKPTAAPGETVTFTITYTNNGTAAYTSGVLDELGVNTTFVSADHGGAVVAGAGYDRPVVGWPALVFEPGTTTTLTLTVKVDAAVTANTVSLNSVRLENAPISPDTVTVTTPCLTDLNGPLITDIADATNSCAQTTITVGSQGGSLASTGLSMSGAVTGAAALLALGLVMVVRRRRAHG